jgi:hypothetical protein
MDQDVAVSSIQRASDGTQHTEQNDGLPPDSRSASVSTVRTNGIDKPLKCTERNIMSQDTPSHSDVCYCRCCNGHYREYRAWIAGIKDESDRIAAQAELETAFRHEYEMNSILSPIPQPQQSIPQQNHRSRLKQHPQSAEVPDGPVDASF